MGRHDCSRGRSGRPADARDAVAWDEQQAPALRLTGLLLFVQEGVSHGPPTIPSHAIEGRCTVSADASTAGSWTSGPRPEGRGVSQLMRPGFFGVFASERVSVVLSLFPQIVSPSACSSCAQPDSVGRLKLACCPVRGQASPLNEVRLSPDARLHAKPAAPASGDAGWKARRYTRLVASALALS